MIYLLITTTGNRNTGDELIRIGFKTLVTELDPKAEFLLLDKEQWHNPETILYDKAILCGMPLFWNNEISVSQTIGWWDALFRYSDIKKNNFLILGVGSVIGIKGIRNEIMFGAAIQEVIDSSFAITVRDNSYKYNSGLIDSICPAAFAVKKAKEPKYRLCTLMHQGAHDTHFNPKEADIWKRDINTYTEYLLDNNFYFIEHASKPYYEDGELLGWPKDKIIRFSTAEEYLDIYSQAECYIGNRMHGAVVTASIGRPALAIGYDSRMEMVTKVNGHIKMPSEIKISYMEDIISQGKKETEVPHIIAVERKQNLEIIKRFIDA